MQAFSLARFVPHLLAVLTGVGTITLGVVTWEAERLISAVDDLRTVQAVDHTDIKLHDAQINAIVPRVDAVESRVYDHELRLVKGGM